ITQIRNLMVELRPPVLDDLGLPPTLRWYADEFERRTEIPTIVRADSIQPRLPRLTETALFRITQEALTNIAKHARAQHAWITLQAAGARAVLTIQDDGVGFDFAEMRRR